MYLLLASILLIVCACLPVGTFYPDVMGASQDLYNMCVYGELSVDFSACGLILLLAVATVNNTMSIFGYNNRKKQASKCNITIVMLLLWIIYYAVYGFVIGIENTTFKPSFTAILPVVSIILVLLARRAIIADEKLVRSVDRIR